jgi:carboxymethylenebutenolidase
MSGLDWKGAVADISGAVSFLREKGAKKVAVVGFCMGGALALASATQDPKIDAVVPFYGIPDLKQWPIQNVKAPIFGNFGETDALKGFSTPEDAKNFEEIAKSHGVQVQIKY